MLSRQSKIEKVPLDISEVLDEALMMFKISTDTNILLTTRFAHRYAITRANYSRLCQIFLNILNNSRDALQPDGRIDILTKTVSDPESLPPRLRIMPRLNPQIYLCIEFIDNGSGISPEDLSHVVDPFFTTKKPGKGTGLGLSIAHDYISKLSGDMVVESQYKYWTKVSIFIPMYPDLEVAEKTNYSAGKDSYDQVLERFSDSFTRSPSILLLDDNEDILSALSTLLEKKNLLVTTASDGHDVLESFREEFPFDIMISDLNLSGINATMIINSLEERHGDFPIIYITGYQDRDLPLHTSKFILQKPFEIASLFSTIMKILQDKIDQHNSTS